MATTLRSKLRALWDNKGMLLLFLDPRDTGWWRMLGATAVDFKGWQRMPFWGRVFYLLSRLTTEDPEVKDLIRLAYYDFIAREKLIPLARNDPNGLLRLQLHDQIPEFIAYVQREAEAYDNDRVNWLTRNAGRPITQDSFEYRLAIKITPLPLVGVAPQWRTNLLQHINNREVIENICMPANERIKAIFYDTFSDYIEKWEVTLRTQFKSVEHRVGEVRNRIHTNPEVARAIAQTFLKICSQDEYFKTLERIYEEQGRTLIARAP